MVCIFCGKEIVKKGFHSKNRKPRFCSQECYHKYRIGKHFTTPLRKCGYCGKEFLDRRYRKKYCSHDCFCKSRLKEEAFFNCVVCGKEKRKVFSKDHANKYCSRRCFNSVKGALRPPTNIEIKLFEVLDKLGINFKKQYLIDEKFCVDAYIPELKLAIEADGLYWHNLPKTINKDRAEKGYLLSRGYKLLRLTEKEILNNDFEYKIVEYYG